MILCEYRTTTATEKVYVAWSYESAFIEEIEGKKDNVLPTYSCRPVFALFLFFIFIVFPFSLSTAVGPGHANETTR